MLHELIGIDHNRVFLKKVANGDMRDIAISSDQDTFYGDNMFNNFGDLAVNIQAYVEHYQTAR